MINNFRVTYTDVERQAPIQSVGAKQSDVIRHALGAKNGVGFKFEKHNGTAWEYDEEANHAYLAKKAIVTKNAPDLNLSASLSSLASAATVLAKMASKSKLSDDQIGELLSLMQECANSQSVRAFSYQNTSNKAAQGATNSTTTTKDAAPAKR